MKQPDLWPAPRAHAPIERTLTLPGSKSVTNRALVLAALANSPSRLRAPLRSRDTALMAAGLQAMGISIETDGADWVVTPKPLRGPAVIDVGNAGTVMRFLPAVAALANGDVSFAGDPRSQQRPLAPLISALRDLGATINGALPLVVSGQGTLRGGDTYIDASASSQFISALLLIGAATDEGVSVHHEGQALPSRPHIAMTIDMLAQVGVAVNFSTKDTWLIDRSLIAGHEWRIEPDLSNAAPFLGAAMATAGSVTINDWPGQTSQPGDQLRQLLTEMGAQVQWSAGALTVTGGESIHGIERDLHEVGELAPTIAALCALADSPSHLYGLAHLRNHETDRLHALETEINALGGSVRTTDDGLVITPRQLHGGTFQTYADHRLATAGALLGLVVDDILVEDVGTTEKTLPNFMELWATLLGNEASIGDAGVQ